MRRRIFPVLFAGLAWSLGCVGAAADQRLSLEGPVERVPVLELFTSHGCSSCPPADAWLRRFSSHSGLWTQVIPLAFHVDYWDWIGWEDRFAAAQYSRRQRDYKSSGALSSVYTPGFVLDGREWKGWFSGRKPGLGPGSEVGRLSLDLEPEKAVRVRFAPAGARPGEPLTAYLAVLGFGISSDVGGGENKGRTLEEDFVVLGLSHSADAGADGLEWKLPWPITVDAETSRRAVVAWVSALGSPRPLQAVAGWLP